MLLLWLLDEPSIKDLKTWKLLRERFLADYRIEILQYCGFDTGRLPLERIRLKNPKLFLGYMSAMLRCGMLLCTYEELSDYIDLIFDTGHEVSTICNLLKSADDVYFDVCNDVREANKSTKEGESDK